MGSKNFFLTLYVHVSRPLVESVYPKKFLFLKQNICAATHDIQQCGILICVESEELVQPPFKLRNSKIIDVRPVA